MEELFGDQDKIFKGETDGEQEEEDEMTEEEMTEEEEEDTDSDEDERGCCDRHYTSALETPLGRFSLSITNYSVCPFLLGLPVRLNVWTFLVRGEKAEYERRLVAAGVPNRVTLSQVVEQVHKSLFCETLHHESWETPRLDPNWTILLRQDFLDFATALGQLADEQADECRSDIWNWRPQ